MDIGFSADHRQFREEVASFLDEAPTEEIREAGRKTTSVFAPYEQVMAWHKILHAKGWSAPEWPIEHGGTGWTVEQRYIFAEEYLRRDLPPLLPNGLQMVGPLLMELGTEDQKRRYLPGILSGADYWSQGYSEPNAGSDLASLCCAAEVDGDDYVINGQKTWATLAHKANRMFILVRTSREGSKQQGITFLLLDRLDCPGLDIRPILGLDGEPEQCEVFFDNVRVPQCNRVGAENDGWAVAKRLLKHERGGAMVSPAMRRRFARILARGATKRLTNDDVLCRDLGELEAEVLAQEAYEKLLVSGHPLKADPATASIMKIIGSELTQRLSVMMLRMAGLEALPQQNYALAVGSGRAVLSDDFDAIAAPYYLNARATTIYAGTNEIQRDLLARSLT